LLSLINSCNRITTHLRAGARVVVAAERVSSCDVSPAPRETDDSASDAWVQSMSVNSSWCYVTLFTSSVLLSVLSERLSNSLVDFPFLIIGRQLYSYRIDSSCVAVRQHCNS